MTSLSGMLIGFCHFISIGKSMLLTIANLLFSLQSYDWLQAAYDDNALLVSSSHL